MIGRDASKGWAAAVLGACAGGLAMVAIFVAVGLACDGAARIATWLCDNHYRAVRAGCLAAAVIALAWVPARAGLARFARWRVYRRVDRRIRRERVGAVLRRAQGTHNARVGQ